MKKLFYYYYIFGFITFCSGWSLAQTEVPILKDKELASIVEFVPPYARIRVNIESDYRDYYSLIDFPDSTLVFMNRNEYRQYESKLQKSERDYKRYEERKQKALASNKKFKEQPPQIFDKKTFQQLRDLLRPGLEVELSFYEYRYSKRFVMKDIIIITDLTGSGSVSGTFEQLDGDIATVDGQAVRLKEGVKIVGEKGYKGLSFSNFKDMEKGMEVKLKGERQKNGILLVQSGTVVPDDFTEVDQKLLTTLKATKKMSLDGREVAFGNATFNLLTDDKINAYVSRIGRKLVPDHIKKLPKDHPAYINFNFFVVIDSTFNACAYPDGSVFVHTQLLNEIQNEAQLAAVLGHEIAHATYRHSRQEYQKSQGIALGQGAATAALVSAFGIQSADLAVSVAAFGGIALSSSYSRELENQADRIGLNYMYEAGYDPREAPKLWERIFQKTPDVPTQTFGARLLSQAVNIGAVVNNTSTANLSAQAKEVAMAALKSNAIASIYASHPSAGKRSKNLNALIIRNYQDSDLINLSKGENEYLEIQKRLRRLVKGLSPTDDSDKQPAEVKPGSTNKPKPRAVNKSQPTNKPKSQSPKPVPPKNKS